MAIFGFSSSNGFSSFNLNFECRSIEIRDVAYELQLYNAYQLYDIEDGIQSYFSYLVQLPYDLRTYTSCEERGYEIRPKNYRGNHCITFFQG